MGGITEREQQKVKTRCCQKSYPDHDDDEGLCPSIFYGFYQMDEDQPLQY